MLRIGKKTGEYSHPIPRVEQREVEEMIELAIETISQLQENPLQYRAHLKKWNNSSSVKKEKKLNIDFPETKAASSSWF